MTRPPRKMTKYVVTEKGKELLARIRENLAQARPAVNRAVQLGMEQKGDEAIKVLTTEATVVQKKLIDSTIGLGGRRAQRPGRPDERARGQVDGPG